MSAGPGGLFAGVDRVDGEMERGDALRTRELVRGMRDEFVAFVSRLCEIESPTDRPETQAAVHAILGSALAELGFDVRIVRARRGGAQRSGDHLLASPAGRARGVPTQLLVGHTDTVWPLETLERMPVRIDDGRLFGPGTLDMKGGLTMAIFALRALRRLGVEPEVTPVLFLNSDEEVGSPDSKRHVRRLARASSRALVLEPALGLDGRIKTTRKGVGRFEIVVQGKAAHAGLDPTAGASAIVELAHVIHRLDSLNDPERGTTLNVGLVDGGTRPNVVAARARASVDVRVTTVEEGHALEEKIRAIRPVTPGVTLKVDGGMGIRPLERTPRNARLWEYARVVGDTLGLSLRDGSAGGASDGNTTSQFTATLDGLGCVGDGAHADHEHIVIEDSLDRCALLARLMLAPSRLGG